MLEALAETAVLAWPLALTLASVAVADRWRIRRHRECLNRALHELRRPLQALRLGTEGAADRISRSQLALALDALAGLDEAINGGDAATRSRSVVEVRELVDEAITRWRGAATLRGRRVELRWHANGSRIYCRPAAIARALDNLIANALEHGGNPIRVEAVARSGRLRLLVADGAAAGGALQLPTLAHVHRRGGRAPRRGEADPRRGHGLRIVAKVAADHGGRFATCRDEGGATAVIELPLADG